MSDLKCKYCGKPYVYGFTCAHGPNKKHVALADGKHCVYCGKKFVAGFSCSSSPAKKHQLDS